MDDKKVVNTQYVKYIESPSRPKLKFISICQRQHWRVVEDTGLVTNNADSHPADGVSQPSIPLMSAQTMGRMSTRGADKMKPSRWVRDIPTSFMEVIDNEGWRARWWWCFVQRCWKLQWPTKLRKRYEDYSSRKLEDDDWKWAAKPTRQPNVDCGRKATWIKAFSFAFGAQVGAGCRRSHWEI